MFLVAFNKYFMKRVVAVAGSGVVASDLRGFEKKIAAVVVAASASHVEEVAIPVSEI